MQQTIYKGKIMYSKIDISEITDKKTLENN